jgi:hypothetical protein
MSITINGTTGIAGVDGSAATPSVQGADANTGMFFPAADTIAFAEGGVEVMRIDSSGNVGIGTTAPGAKLDVVYTGLPFRIANSTTSGYALAQFGQSATTTQNWHIGSEGDGTFRWYNGVYGAGTERMRIDGSGNTFMGTTTDVLTAARLTVKATGSSGIVSATSSNVNLFCVNTNAASWDAISFRYNTSTEVGRISCTSTATTYTTSSDYRLKENVQPMAGALDKIAQLNPVTYTWKSDGSDGQGFIAHELQAVIPDCVTGEKDAVDADGKPQYQGIDTSFLVATLVKAVQEQQATITALEARIAALEAK